MREYELILVIHPELDETAFNDVVTRVSNWVTEAGGEILKTDLWGKRRLAYPIRKQMEGQYVLLNTKMAPKVGADLDRNLRFVEPVMRYILVAKDE